MTARVALGGFLHETNSFAIQQADFAAFVRGGGYIPMTSGAALLEAARGINLGIAGAIAHGEEAGWEMTPLAWAGAIPSGPVTRDAFERIAGDLVARLGAALPVDGVFLDLHGAMQAEHVDDAEGELLARVRDLVGATVPIAASLDLHGNITARMVELADLLVGFRTYPHIDMAETGRRAAEGLTRMLATGRRPAKAFRRLGYLVPIPWQCTDIEPAAGLYRSTVAREADGASASLFMGFPATDFAECGPTVIAYGATQGEADTIAARIAEGYARAEPDFRGRAWPAEDAVAEARRLAVTATGPIVLADTQDNPGAGGSSNTTGLLRALVAGGAENAALGLLVDPAAAAAAHEAGPGAALALALGGGTIPGDRPFQGTFAVEALSDGRITAPGPYYGGARLDLGPSACLRIGGVRVVVTTHIAQMADRAMFRMVGIEPEATAILAVKSSTHFRADFAPIAGAILIATSPGAMPLDPAELPWRHIDPRLRLSPLGPTRAELGAAAQSQP